MISIKFFAGAGCRCPSASFLRPCGRHPQFDRRLEF